MVTKIINHLVFEPAKVSIMANCGSGITIGSTHTTAPIGEGSLTVVVYTTLPNENILINFNYEDSSCSPTMTLTTAINPECIEVKIIEIECIEPEIPIISYDCDNGLVISNFDNNLTYNYLPGAFLTEGNYVLTVSNNGCIKEVPFTVQSCCFNYGVIANYSCSTKKLNITIYDTVTDSYIPGNPNWVVNADIADPAHCTSYVNPIPMTYFPSGNISMSSTGTLNLCNGSYSINIYLQVNNSCIIGTTMLVDCPCDNNVTVDYTCNSKELIVNTTCISCNAYIKKLNGSGFLYGNIPDDGTVLPLFPLYGEYPTNDYYYSIPSVNTLLAVNSFINSNDLGQLGSLSNGYYLVVLENGDCYTTYKFRVSCNEIECNLIHYDEGDVNDTDIRVIDVTGITGNVYIDLMTGGYPDSIELYYSNNNTATLSSLTSDTILVRTPPIVDYQCLSLDPVINGFWQNNIGTGVTGNPYIWNGVNTSLYSISDNVPVDFTIPGSTWIATYPHAGGNPFDNYYSIPLSVYTANISNIDSGNYNGVYSTSTNAYLSNDHMFISSSGRLNFNLDGSKNYIKLRLRYNENSCKDYFPDGITPWISGFVYNFPFCNDCVYSGLTVGINIDNYNSTNGQITLSASSVGFNNLINPTYKWYIINSNEPLDDVGHAEFSSYTIDKYNTVGNTVYINQVGKICAGSSFIYESDFAVFVVATDDNGHTVYSYFKHNASCALDYIHYAALEPLLVNSGSFYNININDFDFYSEGSGISGCTDNVSGFIENLSINGGWSGSINNSDVNHIYSGNMGEVNGVIIFGSNPCNPNMLVRSSFHVGCIDCERITAPIMQLVQANCVTFSDAYIEVTQGCGVGYQLQLSIDGGISWTDINVGYILPLTGVEGYTYSVIVRCVHKQNLTCYALSNIVQYQVETCDCNICNPSYTITSANPCNDSNGSVTIDNFDLCDNTTFYLNGTPINLGINGWDNLSAGIYTLQYTSNDGCINSEQIEILNTSSTISFDVNDITLLCGSENSLINIINISGGVSPYYIEIKNSIGAILESATGITTSNYTSTTLFNSGLYNITVKDSLSCVSSSLMNIIPCSTPLTFTHSVINSTCNGSNGSITINGLSGTNTVAIKLNGTNDVDGGCSCSFMTGWTTSIITTTNYTFNSLAAGSYQVCIENSNECCYCKTITVNNDGYNCIASCGSSIGNVLSSSVGTNQLNGLCDRTICQGQNLSFYFALSGTNCNLTPTFKLDGNTISNTVLTGGYGVVLSGLSAGVHTLNVSYGICGDDIDYIITVVAKPIINTISNITVCNGGSVNIDITGTVGANYTYTHNNTSIIGIANSGSGTIDGSPDISFTAINNTTTPKVVTFTVTPIGVNCNGTPVTFNVTINPTPSIVLNDIIKCKGQLVSTISLPSTYTWTNNNTSIGLAASGTGSIPSFTTLNSGTAIITVTPIQLGCIGTPETFEIFVEDAPVTSPVNNIAVCHNSIVPEIDFVSTIDSFYTWTSSINLGVGYSGSGSFPSFTAANLGTTPLVSTITVYTNSELGCPGNTITFTITVYPKLADTTVHEIEICQNQMLNYDCSIDNCVSGTGSYSSPNLPVGFSLNSITGIVSGSTNLVSTISFTINFICNHGNGVECSTSNNYVLTTVCCGLPAPILSSNSTTFNSIFNYNYIIFTDYFKCCLSSSPNGSTYLFSSTTSTTTGFTYIDVFTGPVYNYSIPGGNYTHPTTIYFRAICAVNLETAIQCINNPGCNTNWSNVITLSTTA